MPRKSALSVVKPGETVEAPPKPRAKTLKEAVERSERELLVMMRERVAVEIDNGPPAHTLAPLARQLRDLDREIRLLDEKAKQEAGEGVSIPDDEWDAEAF
jgi:hypothetical protein